MACNSYSMKGIGLGCKDHTGGIKEVYLIDESNIESVTLDPEKSMIQSISVTSSEKFKTYRFRKGTSNMTSTASSSEENGTFSVQTNIALKFNKMDTAKRMEVMAMCLGSVKGIVKDNNNKYWFVGYDAPISATAATGETGTAYADFGGYNVTLTDDSKEFPYELSASCISSLSALIEQAPEV